MSPTGFDLRRDIQFDTRVTAARVRRRNASLDSRHRPRRRRLRAVLRDGDRAACPPRACRISRACEDFKGEIYHTGHWPHEGVDFTGKRVGVIGTGSSAIQAIPVIAQQAAHLTVFQRTPNFSIPSRNGPMTGDYAQSWKSDYPTLREQARHMRTGILDRSERRVGAGAVRRRARSAIYEARWAAAARLHGAPSTT